ncbi:MAG: SLBB domain-containing protein, partial [Desulfobacterales bacterium]|nr:SLBB domain-containing protein [Desulfobacterales bacterium]
EVAPGAAEPPMGPEGNGASGEEVIDTAALLEELSEDLDATVEEDAEELDGEAVPSLDEALEDAEREGPGRWVNINGEWVMVQSRGPVDEEGVELEGGVPPAEQLVTQRVIEIDARALMEGQAKYNIVVRPGDIIRVPAPESGNVFIAGEIARPGTYALPGKNRLTLRQLILSAGGFSPLAVPERVDLVRRIDHNTEATVRLNTRAIFEGVHPDLFLKPDDQIIIGTNLPATFAAVARNGFRVSYGFGFLLDRNFGTDVFGAVSRNN